jgi:L-amino acid N-acyltransferase YncA
MRVRSPAVTEGPGVTIRLATIGDAERICQIYNHEVLTSTATFDLVPRSLDEQEAWIAERTGAFAALVAVDASGALLGFGSLSPYKERAAYRTSVEDSVYVDRTCHGRGVGKLIVSELLGVAALSGFHTVFARIEAGGVASRALHASCGFELVGIEREVGRKFHRWLDVAIMQRLL